MRKILCVLLATTLLFGVFVLPSAAQSSYGDGNGDGVVNAADALTVLLVAVNKDTATNQQTKSLDVDGSGSLNADDALLILKYAVGKLKQFPIEDPTTESSDEVDQTPSQPENNGIASTDQGNADEITNLPTFASESALNQWLLSGDSSQKDLSETLSVLSNGNTVQYYRPLVSRSDDYVLHHVEVHPPSGTADFHYDKVNENTNDEKHDLIIIACWGNRDVEARDFNRLKERYNNGEENCYSTTVGDIEYVYYRNEKKDVTVIRWMQFGVGHSASLHGQYDQLDEILPLLKLERVTLSTGSTGSTVTQ